jgi:hypothetical protein
MVAGCGDGPAVGFSVEDDPVPVREVLPTAVEGSPLGSKMKAVPLKLVSPDELLPHVPAYADLKPIDQQTLTGVLNTVDAPCAPCEGRSFAGCLTDKPSGCDNLAELVKRTVDLIHAGVAPADIRGAVLYTDVWLPVPKADRPVDGDPKGMPFEVWLDPSTGSVRTVINTLDGLDLRSTAITYRIVSFSDAPVDRAWAAATIAAESQGKLEPWLRATRTWRDEKRADQPSTDLEITVEEIDVVAAVLISGGLDMAQFKRDRTSPGTSARIDADLALAETLGVRVAPTWFADGYRLRGAQSALAIQRIINLERPHYVRVVQPAPTGEQ